MPPIPNFTNDDEKIYWLRQYFKDEDTYYKTLNAWDVRTQNCDACITYAGYIAGILVSILATLQTAIVTGGHFPSNPQNTTDIINTNNSNNSVINGTSLALGYLQVLIGWLTLLVGAVAKIIKEVNQDNLKRVRENFPFTFFQKHPTNQIWIKNPKQDENNIKKSELSV